mmetsp:Transcript_3230/g.12048  ORF Transcript_3230/g.12048 Transcript_3230/m.12048 type:complete len:246 (+) Transcript_3230:527-1264(+)
MDPRGRLAVGVREEIVRVVARHSLVELHVRSLDDVLEISFEQRHLAERVLHSVRLRARFVVCKHDVVDVRVNLAEETLHAQVFLPTRPQQLVHVDVHVPVQSLSKRLSNGNFHVERLSHKELVVARFLEEVPEPVLFPRPRLSPQLVQLRARFPHRHARERDQLLHRPSPCCSALHKQKEMFHPQQPVVPHPVEDLTRGIRGGRADHDLERVVFRARLRRQRHIRRCSVSNRRRPRRRRARPSED